MMNTQKKYNFSINGSDVQFSYTDKDGIDVTKIASDNYVKRSDFNYAFVNFNSLFAKIDLTDSSVLPSNLFVLSDNKALSRSFDQIKEYANITSRNDLSFSQAHSVLAAYKDIYQQLDDIFSWKQSTHFVVPLKGGGYILRLFDMATKQVLPIEAKRVPLKKQGQIALGMNVDGISDLEINQFYSKVEKEVMFLEVCVASGLTTLGFLLDMYSRNKLPKKITILSAAVSLQGVNLINRISSELGITVEFKTAKVFTKLADFFIESQDSLLYDDGSFVVKSPEIAFIKSKYN